MANKVLDVLTLKDTNTGKTEDYELQDKGARAQIAAQITARTDSDADYAAEVVDARVGADGTQYTSLGNAIRGQKEDADEQITQLKEDVMNVNPMENLYGLFSKAKYDTTNKKFVNVPNQLSMKVPIMLDKDIVVRVKNDFQFCVFYWDSTDVSNGWKKVSGWKTIPRTIPKNTYFTISLVPIQNRVVTIDEVRNLYSDTILDLAEKEQTDIDNLSNRVDEIEISSDTEIVEVYKKSLFKSFAKVGVIGDSYSAVRLYYYDNNNVRHSAGDVPYYSWGKCMERMSNMKYEIFAKDGLECSQWLTDTDNGYPVASQSDNLCQAYIIALGINDSSRHDTSYVGTVADINDGNCENNANSFIGNYAKIIQKMKTLQPQAKFFVVTMPTFTSDTNKDRYNAYNDGIRAIANHFDDVYLVDLYAKYFDLYNKENGFFANNVINGHYTPVAYQLIAEIISTEISSIMYENPNDFSLIEFIGKTDGTYWCN